LFHVVNVLNVLLLFVDAFNELKTKLCNLLVICVCYLILYLCCKFHSNIPNDCQDFANLLQEYFNLGHRVYVFIVFCLCFRISFLVYFILFQFYLHLTVTLNYVLLHVLIKVL